ncbi:MAG: hypothetical protein M3066_03970 [Actinomycetota bacterium]|nr:hypothetical protein [Actinomycetota bacterium]
MAHLGHVRAVLLLAALAFGGCTSGGTHTKADPALTTTSVAGPSIAADPTLDPNPVTAPPPSSAPATTTPTTISGGSPATAGESAPPAGAETVGPPSGTGATGASDPVVEEPTTVAPSPVAPGAGATPDQCAALRQLSAFVDNQQLHQLAVQVGCS